MKRSYVEKITIVLSGQYSNSIKIDALHELITFVANEKESHAQIKRGITALIKQIIIALTPPPIFEGRENVSNTVDTLNEILKQRTLSANEKIDQLSKVATHIETNANIDNDYSRNTHRIAKTDLITHIKMLLKGNVPTATPQGHKNVSTTVTALNEILTSVANTKEKLVALTQLKAKVDSNKKAATEIREDSSILVQQVFQLLTTFHAFNMANIPTPKTPTTRTTVAPLDLSKAAFEAHFTEQKLIVGDVIELTSVCSAITDIPKHFLLNGPKGDWSMGRGTVKFTGELIHLIGDYVVIDISDSLLAGYRVTCMKVNDKTRKVEFFQSKDSEPYIKDVYLKGSMKVEKKTEIVLTPLT
ncbi:MAG: hypothetical protein COB09_18660 [Thalassobium sp.]|nr:MAG: hypothetical protein COB09_18660 [Thalassobium sp.]